MWLDKIQLFSWEGAYNVESIIKCRRNRYGFSCIIFLSEGRRKEVKTLNGYSYLTLEQRREIERMYAEGERVVDIAARLKRSAAAIYEELKRGYTGEFDHTERARPTLRISSEAEALCILPPSLQDRSPAFPRSARRQLPARTPRKARC